MQIVDPTRLPEWDDFVRSFGNATIFHSSSWARVLKETYGFGVNYFVNSGQDGSPWAMPMMEIDSTLFGRKGASLPFTDEVEMLSFERSSVELMMRFLHLHARHRRWKFVEYRGMGQFIDSDIASTSYYSHRINLSKDESALISSFESSVQRAIRKAEKEGIRVRISNDIEAIETFYKLFCLTRRKHGLPPQSIQFFRNIQHHLLLREKGFIATAFYKGKAVATAMIFKFADKAVYKYAASDHNFQHLRPSNLVISESLRYLRGLGCLELHFGRTSITNEGLRRFKLGWGSEEYQLHYHRYDFEKEQYVRSKDQAAGWYNGFFRVMPLPISRLIGSSIYKLAA